MVCFPENPPQNRNPILDECVQEHENVHFLDYLFGQNGVRCNSDGVISPGQTGQRPEGPITTPQDKSKAECPGYTAHLKCLNKKLPGACSNPGSQECDELTLICSVLAGKNSDVQLKCPISPDIKKMCEGTGVKF